MPFTPGTVWKVARPQGGNNMPLVTHFVYTGEAINPYRCELCITPKQRQALAAKGAAANWEPLSYPDNVAPRICRKCGLDFYR